MREAPEMRPPLDSVQLDALAVDLGSSVRHREPMVRHTAMRIGGPADLLLVAESKDAIVTAVRSARERQVPWRVLGSGCNVLVSDAGLRGLTIINRAAYLTITGSCVEVEAGALLRTVARDTVEQGLEGLQWAAGLPGTVGGAVVGNAGAFEGDIASVLLQAQVLNPEHGVEERPASWFDFDYRLSRIKRATARERHVVLAATFELQPGDRAVLRGRVAEIIEWRQTRHPAGATMGSTFKNPPGNHAGYLIEQAGLRGYRIGGAQGS